MAASKTQIEALRSISPEGRINASSATLRALLNRGLVRTEPSATRPVFTAVRITVKGEQALRSQA